MCLMKYMARPKTGTYRNACYGQEITQCIYDTNTWCVQILRSPKEAFAAAIQSWRERCEKCVCLQGDYVEK